MVPKRVLVRRLLLCQPSKELLEVVFTAPLADRIMGEPLRQELGEDSGAAADSSGCPDSCCDCGLWDPDHTAGLPDGSGREPPDLVEGEDVRTAHVPAAASVIHFVGAEGCEVRTVDGSDSGLPSGRQEHESGPSHRQELSHVGEVCGRVHDLVCDR